MSINHAMQMLAAEGGIFVGQSVRYPGAMFNSLDGVPYSQRVEFPVAEGLQLGYCIGLALAGHLPVCIFPRMDFTILALDQLVNHLDKMHPQPKVIIRTAIGSRTPLNAGEQHTQDHVSAYQLMMPNIPIYRVENDADIANVYKLALKREGSIIVVEKL